MVVSPRGVYFLLKAIEHRYRILHIISGLVFPNSVKLLIGVPE